MDKKTLYTLGAITAVTGISVYFAIKYIKRVRNVEKEQVEGNTEESNALPNTNFEFPNATGNTVAKTANFSIDEFNSNDGVKVPQQYMANVQQVMNQLEVIRKALGNTPIRINSGYRSYAHNKAVGGKTNSMHLIGKAADFTASGYTPSQIKAVIEKLIAEKKDNSGRDWALSDIRAL